MDDFARTLRSEIRASLGKPDHPKVNPFEVIGLTQAILDLHLSEEQLFPAVRVYVRQLASQVHPDRNPTNISDERRRQIFDAFEELDDREKFSAALTEFRNLKSGERNEINLLNSSLRAAQAELGELRGRQASVNISQNELRERESALLIKERLVSSQEVRFAQFEREAYSNSRKLELAERKLRTSEAEKNGFKRYVSEIGSLEGLAGAVHVFDAHWVAVIHLARGLGLKESGIVKAVSRLNLENFSAKSVLEMYNLACLRHSDGNSRARLSLSIFSLSVGRPRIVYGPKQKSKNYRIIGSVDSAGTRSPYLGHSREFVIYGLVPWLVPGNIMVRSLVRMIESKRAGRMVPSTRFDTGHVILAVG